MVPWSHLQTLKFIPINFFSQVCEQLDEMLLWVQEVNHNWQCVYKRAFLDKMIVSFALAFVVPSNSSKPLGPMNQSTVAMQPSFI